jgi:hypothetical protein
MMRIGEFSHCLVVFPFFQRAGGAPMVAAAARGSLAKALTGLIGALGLLRLL